MNPATILALIVFVVGVPLNLYVFLKLRKLRKDQPRNAVLRDRIIVQGAVLVLVVVFGLIFLNNDLDAPILSFEDSKIGTRAVAAILAIVPAAYWLRIYRPSEPAK